MYWYWKEGIVGAAQHRGVVVIIVAKNCLAAHISCVFAKHCSRICAAAGTSPTVIAIANRIPRAFLHRASPTKSKEASCKLPRHDRAVHHGVTKLQSVNSSVNSPRHNRPVCTGFCSAQIDGAPWLDETGRKGGGGCVVCYCKREVVRSAALWRELAAAATSLFPRAWLFFVNPHSVQNHRRNPRM